MKGIKLIVAICLLMMIGGAGSAFAEGTEPPSGPTYDAYLKAINSDTSGSHESHLTDPQAAAQLPHRDLGRDEALALIKAVFGPALKEPAGPFDELEVTKFLSDNVAVVAGGDQPEELESNNQGPVLLDSTVPLRTEDSSDSDAAVDLSLEQSGGELQPANPLVDVSIPGDLGEGLAFPGADVRIIPEGVPEDRSPSTIDQSVAFYPNVARDTDLALATTLGGVESLTQLRSPEAPRTESFQVELPSGASLLPAESGGAVVQGIDGETLLSISAPSAIDAAGEGVPSTLEITGEESIALHVSPAEDAQYPILVDPLIDEYVWGPAKTTAGLNDWKAASTNVVTYPYSTWANCQTSCYSGLPHGWPGLYIGGVPYSGTWPGATTEWDYFVPRWQTEWSQNNRSPTSFIDSMYFWSVGYWHRTDSNVSPFLVMGIYRPAFTGWASQETWAPNKGDLNETTGFNFHVQAGDYESKEGVFSLVSTDSHGLTSYRDAYLGYAQVVLGDVDNPSFGMIAPVPQWVNSKPTSAIPFTASDKGLGVYSVAVTDKQTPAHSWVTSAGCTGGAASPCPLTWKYTDAGRPALNYDPSVLPQGTNTLKVSAKDPVGNEYSINTQVKVDHTAPAIALSGSITEQATLGTKRPSYLLKVVSTDGTEGSPQSGVASTEISIDGKKVDSTSTGCATSNCSIAREWTLNSLSYAPGKHVVIVKATDGVGLVTEKTLNIEVQRDTISPTIAEVGGALKTAPEGWVEQKTYALSAKATDTDFGITSVAFKIDGVAVKTVSQSCPSGACKGELSASVNMASYKGGAHAAEVVVSDGAGNSSKSTWTINVDPTESVPPAEAITTLEAAEQTGEVSLLSPPVEPAEIAEGNNPGLEGLKSTGTAAPTIIEATPGSGFNIGGPEEEEIHIEPTVVSGSATEVITVEKSVGLSANTSDGVDTVLMPTYDGTMVFQAIRDSASPQVFSWRVDPPSGETMKSINSELVQVYFEDGEPAMLIRAEIARDATGKAVPTTLSAAGDVITLTVSHQGKGFVYPISAGPAFQVGYRVPEVYNPPPPPNIEKELMERFGNSEAILEVGPPVPVGNGDEFDATASSVMTYKRHFHGHQCEPHIIEFPPIDPGCASWDQEMEGVFFFNNRYAWWKNSSSPPLCPHHVGPLIDIDTESCGWVGPNHQKYGGGYHITAQVYFDVVYLTDPIVFSHVMTIRMFGKGGVHVHPDESCICNPST